MFQNSRNRRGMALIAALGALLGASTPMAAAGQAAQRWNDAWTGPRPALEAFYTRVGFEGARLAGSGTVRAGGFGARVMWPLASIGDGGVSWLARHTAVGLFGVYTPEQNVRFAAGQFGAAVDLTPFAAPLAGRVEPFVSLGAGALRTTMHTVVVRPAPRPGVHGGAALAPVAERSTTSTNVLLVPSVGARVHLRPGVAIQGDLRNLVTFGDAARRHYPAFGTGLRLTF